MAGEDKGTDTTATAGAPDAAATATAAVSSPATDAAPAVAAVAADAGATAAAKAAETTPAETAPSLISAAKPELAAAPVAAKDGTAPAKTDDAAKPATADAQDAKDKPQDAKPAAESKDKPAAETAPADKAPAAEPQARKYEAFKLPEGVKLADKETTEFTGILDDGALSHQERAQKLVDLYVRESQRLTNEINTQQKKAWTDFTDTLKADFKSDPELGGNRQDTTLGIAKAVIEKFGGSAEQKSDLYAMLDHTGMGNHKGLVRVLNNVFETFMREGSPVPGNPPNRQGFKTRQDAFYGGEAAG